MKSGKHKEKRVLIEKESSLSYQVQNKHTLPFIYLDSDRMRFFLPGVSKASTTCFVKKYQSYMVYYAIKVIQ